MDYIPNFGDLIQEYEKLFVSAVDETSKQNDQDFEKNRRIRPTSDYFLYPEDSFSQTSGEARLVQLEQLLENGFGMTRHKHQRRFHDFMLQAVAQWVVGSDWASCGERIMRERGWTNTKKQALIMTPRRWGKTTAVSMFEAAICIVMKGSIQATFSTARRASRGLLEMVYKFICKGGFDAYIIRYNIETLELQLDPDDNTSIAKINSYPSNPRVLYNVTSNNIAHAILAFCSKVKSFRYFGTER